MTIPLTDHDLDSILTTCIELLTLIVNPDYLFAADSERGLYSSRGNRWNRSPGLRTEEAVRGRVPEEDGRTVRVCPVHGIAGQIRGPRCGFAGQVSGWS